MLLRASLVQFFLHICYMWFSFWGTKSPRLHTEPGLCPWTPMGDFRPQTPHILISQLAKLSYTHGRTLVEARTWRARERGAPSRVQGQSPWSGGQGAKPPEAESLLSFQCPMKAAKFTPLTNWQTDFCHVSTTLNRVPNTSLLRSEEWRLQD